MFMEVTVTLSANAGVAIQCGGYRIWVDALHDQKVEGFSTVDAQLQAGLLKNSAFADPDFICYTHCHPDHFSEELTQKANRLWRGAKLLLPEPIFEEQILIRGDDFVHYGDGIFLRFFRLPHEGAVYADTVHYGILIGIGGKHILIPGDCATAHPRLAEFLKDVTVDLALLNFPWLGLQKGRAFVKKTIKPAHVIAYHLPFEEDDCFGYRKAAQKAIGSDGILLWDSLQQITLDI